MSKKNLGGWSNFFKGSGLSVAPKPKCVITQPISRMAFYDVLTSSSSSPSTTISLALVSFWEKVGKASKILTLWQPLPSVQRSWNFNSPNDVCHFQVTHFSSFLSLYLYKTSIGLVNTKTALWFMLDKLIRSIDFRQRSWLKCLDNQDPATILGPPGGHFGFLRLSLKILLNQKLIEDKLIRGSNYLGLDLPENN